MEVVIALVVVFYIGALFGWVRHRKDKRLWPFGYYFYAEPK